MKSKQLQRAFFKTFLVTVLSILSISFIVIGVFFYITDRYKPVENNNNVEEGDQVSWISEVKIKSAYLELLMVVNKDKKAIENVGLSLFSCRTGNLDLITIPADCEVEVSEKLYKRLVKANDQVPKKITISKIPEYFDLEDSYQYAQLICEELVGYRFNFYSVIDSKLFDDYLKLGERSYYVDGKTKDYKVMMIADGFIKDSVQKKPDEKTVPAYITDVFSKIESSLTVSNRLLYAPYYLKVVPENIYYWHAAGKTEDDTERFVMDKDGTKELIKKIRANGTYTRTQDEFDKFIEKSMTTSSKELKIKVLNGANSTGLAGKYKNLLTEKGYNVVAVGDYDNEMSRSLIITTKENTGYDLANYFRNASISCEPDKVPAGVDILIVVGKEDIID